MLQEVLYLLLQIKAIAVTQQTHIISYNGKCFGKNKAEIGERVVYVAFLVGWDREGLSKKLTLIRRPEVK